jgi:hypothetical protein
VQVEKAALRLGMAQLLLVFDPEGAGRDVRRLLAGELSPDQAEKIRDNLDAACQALTGRR